MENSWGREAANAGYYVMSREWFNEWMYQIAVDVSLLSNEVASILEQEATILDAWDPMGSLAGVTQDMILDSSAHPRL